MTPRHIATTYAHGFIAKLFLKEFGSNRVSCRFNTTAERKFLQLMLIGSFDRTWFMTVLDVHRIKSDNRRVTKALVDTQSISKELEGWREG